MTDYGPEAMNASFLMKVGTVTSIVIGNCTSSSLNLLLGSRVPCAGGAPAGLAPVGTTGPADSPGPAPAVPEYRKTPQNKPGTRTVKVTPSVLLYCRITLAYTVFKEPKTLRAVC